MLIQERNAKKLSLLQLGRQLNIRPQVLYAIEKGTVGVNAIRAKVISEAFNKPVEYFFIPTYYKVKKQ
ncbi:MULTISPECIES: helix-turn-helix transcriptional regulator [Bacillus cereus group]|uniref:helix-turn-helix transcriptional regulator n=1 Tax=Bacillus cereus group TaxID=86661 RepID=UPI0011AA2C36|nr:helix-turn-helix transcriptional regulator [Bacillus thuringiensis]MCQ6305794.1 helix-turn-helix domain-containing protein [Bacillus cereus]MED3467774.1 helix-turn-helix transcriptional regulator [Bacillus thuringiensis]